MLDMKEARAQASVDIQALHDLLWGKLYNLAVLAVWRAELNTGTSEWIVRQARTGRPVQGPGPRQVLQVRGTPYT